MLMFLHGTRDAVYVTFFDTVKLLDGSPGWLIRFYLSFSAINWSYSFNVGGTLLSNAVEY